MSSNSSISDDSPIRDYFNDKVVFLTGGFGFIGKILIEKLLKCNVKRIYVMARPKKGKSVTERLESLKDEPIFVDSKMYDFSKITLIYGDLQKLQLGISEFDESILINEVELVYHVAADVRFDENLKEAIEINVRGTREVINLARKIINLNVFTYVSTAFATPSLSVQEKFYPANINPDVLIKLIENMSPEEVENFEILAKRIIQPFPNTYTYTKSLAEQVVKRYAGNLNVAVVRPSIVTATYFEPIKGFADNIYGLNGVLVGAGLGVLRILHINNEYKSNIVPADYVVNLLFTATYGVAYENNFNFIRHYDDSAVDTGVAKSDDNDINVDNGMKVYNFSASDQNYITWRDVKRISTSFGHKYPLKNSLWIITYNTTKYKVIAKVLTILYHVIPAFFIDTALKLKGEKPKLLEAYRKVNKFTDVLSFFTNNLWHFEDKNVISLWNSMTPCDRKSFPFNIHEIDWEEFFDIYSVGLRRHICKESTDTLDNARKRYKRITIIHYLMLCGIYLILLYSFYKIVKFSNIF